MAKYHIFKHLHTVNKHRWHVFINCCHCGIPFRGLVHDLSKYSIREFYTSAKYYRGIESPLFKERQNNGMYSEVAVHHCNRNKHHYEYWIDFYKGDIVLKQMPYKYAVEYCCDVISASFVYNGKKNFKRELPLEYFLRIEPGTLMHSATKEFVKEILIRYKDTRFKNIKKKHTKKLYKEISDKYPKTEYIKVLGNSGLV